MKKITLLGGGGHCHAVVELIRQCSDYTITEILDKDPKKQSILGIPVGMRNDDTMPNFLDAAITIGNNKIRKKIAERFKQVNWPTFVHPTAVVYPSATIGKAVQILPLSVIDAEVSIGDFCIINNGATVSHNVIVGDYCHIAIHVSVAGNCVIGEGVLLGAGCTILPGVSIGKWATIGAGAVVVRDVPDGATVVGNPARIIT